MTSFDANYIYLTFSYNIVRLGQNLQRLVCCVCNSYIKRWWWWSTGELRAIWRSTRLKMWLHFYLHQFDDINSPPKNRYLPPVAAQTALPHQKLAKLQPGRLPSKTSMDSCLFSRIQSDLHTFVIHLIPAFRILIWRDLKNKNQEICFVPWTGDLKVSMVTLVLIALFLWSIEYLFTIVKMHLSCLKATQRADDSFCVPRRSSHQVHWMDSISDSPRLQCCLMAISI